MEHVIDIKDTRKASRIAKAPLTFDRDAAEIILAVTGVEVGPETTIKLRITDQAKGQQGYARRIGPDAFLVKIRVAKQAQYGDSHHYVLNNSLVHELRHVAQMQVTPALSRHTRWRPAPRATAPTPSRPRLGSSDGWPTTPAPRPAPRASRWARRCGR
jgi:hypothetical protein